MEGFPEWAAALGVPIWLFGLAFVIWLWLSGRVMRTQDHDRAMSEARVSCDAELATVHQEAAVRVSGAERTAAALQTRIDHLVVDRDAWRDAHREEALARQAAERAAAALMESTNISVALLSALKDALGGRPHQG